jgi:hypothetical protein
MPQQQQSQRRLRQAEHRGVKPMRFHHPTEHGSFSSWLVSSLHG